MTEICTSLPTPLIFPWQDLSASYGLRNKIIHDGQIAHEDDAKLGIRVARKVVEIVASLTDSPQR